MLVTLALAASFAGLEADISIPGAAMRLPPILKKLSKSSGVALDCANGFEDEVLYVSVNNERLGDLMSDVAEVARGKWEKRENGFILRRPNSNVAQDQKAERRLNLGLLTKAIDVELDGAGSRKNALADRELLTILSLMSPKLAELEPGDHPVYAEHPSRVQIQLPATAEASLAKFVGLQNAAVAKLTDFSGEARFRQAEDLGLDPSHCKHVSSCGQILLTLEYDQVGQIDARASFFDSELYLFATATATLELAPKPDTSELARFSEWSGTPVEPPSGAAEAKAQAIEHPLEHDPLGVALDSPLDQLAKQIGTGIVAALPDECISSGDARSLGAFCRALGNWVSFSRRPGRLLIAPVFVSQSYALRAKRRPLEALLHSFHQHGLASLDAFAAYTLEQNPRAFGTSLETTVLGWNGCPASNFPVVSDLDRRNRSLLRFYGTLTSDERHQIESDGTAFGRLTEHQDRLLSDWIYASDDLVFHTPSRRETREAALGRVRYSALDVPTVRLPNGIPASTVVRILVQEQPAALVRVPDGTFRLYEAGAIGSILASQDRGVMADGGQVPVIKDCKMAPAVRDLLRFDLQFDASNVARQFLSDSRLTSAVFVHYDKLPAPILGEIQEKRKHYGAILDSMPNRGREVPPP